MSITNGTQSSCREMGLCSVGSCVCVVQPVDCGYRTYWTSALCSSVLERASRPASYASSLRARSRASKRGARSPSATASAVIRAASRTTPVGAVPSPPRLQRRRRRPDPDASHSRSVVVRDPQRRGGSGKGARPDAPLVRPSCQGFSTPITSPSTRRFIARPTSVVLSAMGLVSPAPMTWNLLASAPRLIR